MPSDEIGHLMIAKLPKAWKRSNKFGMEGLSEKGSKFLFLGDSIPKKGEVAFKKNFCPFVTKAETSSHSKLNCGT